MGSIPRNSNGGGASLTKKPTKSSRRTRRTAQRRNNCGHNNKSSLSDKLEALRSLIPIARDGGDQADRLFEETADYILKLRGQVFVLQRLVELYGSSNGNSSSTGEGGEGDDNRNDGIAICDAKL